MLDQNQAQLKIAEHAKAAKPPVPGSEEVSGLKKIELEIAAAAQLAKPSGVAQPATAPSTGPFLEELLRAITKFEKPDQSRVVDVFE
jgi:hypothetical protein